MSITRREDILNLSGKINLSITHFGKGTYNKANGIISHIPANRFLIPLDDPPPPASYINDAKDTFVMEVGKGYFIPIFHKAGVSLNPELIFYTVQFHCELFSAIDIFNGQNSIYTFPSAPYISELEKAYSADNPLKGVLLLHNLIQDFIAAYPGKLELEERNSLRLLERYEKIWKYLHYCPPGKINVTDLANLYPGRRETFTRHFTRDMGLTPKEYLQKYTLRKACELLTGNDLLVKEIATLLGFSNEYYFSRFFHKYMSLTPLAYRKSRLF